VRVALPEGQRYQGPIKNGAWIAAGDLRPGEKLFDSDGSWSSVVDVRIEDKPLKAYNLTVADFHTYFVKQAANDYAEPVWVHNSCAVYKTTKEAQLAANELGYVRISETSHGQAIFKKGNLYITRDIDGHSGGAWKMATSVKDLGSKSTRLGTFDINLNRIGD
jgi:hypothetical protein